MPRKADSANSSTTSQTASNKRKPRSRSRSRGRAASPSRTTVNSRSQSPSRGQGRQPGRGRGRPKTPPRQAKTTPASSEPLPQDSNSLSPTPNVASVATRTRKHQADTRNRLDVRGGVVPNGTSSLSVLVDRMLDGSNGHSTRIDSPRPKINASIFENICLTPSKVAANVVEERPVTTTNITPVIGKPAKRMMIQLRKVLAAVGNRTPSWKVLVAFIIGVILIAFLGYIYAYHSDAVVDYYKIIKSSVRKTWKGEL